MRITYSVGGNLSSPAKNLPRLPLNKNSDFSPEKYDHQIPILTPGFPFLGFEKKVKGKKNIPLFLGGDMFGEMETNTQKPPLWGTH